MHDTESDTFVYQTWPEKFVEMLSEIGVNRKQKKLQQWMLSMVIITVDISLKLQEWLQTRVVLK